MSFTFGGFGGATAAANTSAAAATSQPTLSFGGFGSSSSSTSNAAAPASGAFAQQPQQPPSSHAFTPAYTDYAPLLKVLYDCLHDLYSLPTLASTLRSYTHALTTQINPTTETANTIERTALRSSGLNSSTGYSIRLTDVQIDSAIQLSEALGISETTAVHLLYLTAHQWYEIQRANNIVDTRTAIQQLNASATTIKDLLLQLALDLYYTQRTHLLTSLLHLFTLHQFHHLHDKQLQLLVNEYGDELLNGGIVGQLLALIRALVKKVLPSSRNYGTENALTPLIQQYSQRELHHALRVLLEITGKHLLSSSELKELVTLVQITSVSSSTSQLPSTGPAASLFGVSTTQQSTATNTTTSDAHSQPSKQQSLPYYSYLLVIITIQSFNYRLYAMAQPTIEAQQIRGDWTTVAQTLQAFTDEGQWLDANYNDQIYGFFLLSYTLFLRQARPLLPNDTFDEEDIQHRTLIALSSDINVFVALHQWVCDDRLLQDEYRLAYAAVFGDFLVSFFAVDSFEIHAMRKEFGRIEALQHQAQQRAQTQRPAHHHAHHQSQPQQAQTSSADAAALAINLAQHNLPSCYHLVADTVNLVGSLASQLMIDDNFCSLLTTDLRSATSSNLLSPLTQAYMAVFEALCSDSQCCLQVHEWLKQLNRLNYDVMFSYFQQTITQYTPQVIFAEQQQFQPTQQSLGASMRSSHGSSAFNPQQQQLQQQYMPPQIRQPPNITAKDATLLRSFLSLLQAVCNTHSTQLAIIRSTEYRALDRLFGLLSCKFSPSLKAAVMDTITAVARHNEDVSDHVWSRLERSQIIPTAHLQIQQPTNYTSMLADQMQQQQQMAATNAQHLQGILYDLEDIESSQHDYPLTLSFLRLLLVLLHSATQPVSLGAGLRTPGIAPYIDFVRNNVFLKLDARQYNVMTQRWQLAEACIAIFSVLVQQYEPSAAVGNAPLPQQASEASNGTAEAIEVGMIGRLLAQDILTATELYQQLITISTHAHYILDSNSAGSMDGSRTPSATYELTTLLPEAESCNLLGLKLLSLCAERQDAVVEYARTHDIRVQLYTIPQMLLEQHNSTLLVIKSVGYILQHKPTFVRLVEHHQTSEAKAGSNASTAIDSVDKQVLSDETALAVADPSELAFYAAVLLQSMLNVNQAKVVHAVQSVKQTLSVITNIARQLELCSTKQHYASQTSREQSVVLPLDRANRTRLTVLDCLASSVERASHSDASQNVAVFLLGYDLQYVEQTDLNLSAKRPCLDAIIDLAVQSTQAHMSQALVCATYKLMYTLLHNSVTSRPFNAYLDLKHPQLIERLLYALVNHQLAAQQQSSNIFTLHAYTYLLQSVAHRLYAAAVLIDQSLDATGVVESVLQQLGFIELTNGQSQIKREGDEDNGNKAINLNAFDLLESCRVSLHQSPDVASIPTFVGQSDTALCKYTDPIIGVQYDLRQLYKLLVDNRYDAAAASKVCTAAFEWNQVSALTTAASKAFDGWRQLMQMAITVAMQHRRTAAVLEQPLVELLHGLLAKTVSDDPCWVVLSESLAATTVVIMSSIRELAHKHDKFQSLFVDTTPHITSGAQHTPHLILATLLNATDLLVTAITSTKQQTTRANLYATLLHLLHYSRTALLPPFEQTAHHFIHDLVQRTLRLGSTLYALLLNDALDGAGDVRTVALALINVLLEVMYRVDAKHATPMIRHIHQRSAVPAFLQQLKQRDAFIRQAISSNAATNADQLSYVDTMLTMFTNLSLFETGALLLVECDTVRSVATMTFVTNHIHQWQQQGKLSDSTLAGLTPVNRYNSTLMSVLQLFNTLSQTLPLNVPLHQQLMEFVYNQDELVSTILRDDSHPVTLLTLQVLQQTVLLLYRLHAFVMAQSKNLGGGASSQQFRPTVQHLSKYKKLLLILFLQHSQPHLSNRIQAIRQQIVGGYTDTDIDEGRHTRLPGVIHSAVQEIVHHLVSIFICMVDPICQTINGSSSPVLLFGPSLQDASLANNARQSYDTQGPQLSALTMVLETSTSDSMQLVKQCNKRRAGLQSLRDAHDTDAAAVLSRVGLQQVLLDAPYATNNKQALTALMSSELTTVTVQLDRVTFVVESSLLLLFHHLQLYLVGIPSNQQSNEGGQRSLGQYGGNTVAESGIGSDNTTSHSVLSATEKLHLRHEAEHHLLPILDRIQQLAPSMQALLKHGNVTTSETALSPVKQHHADSSTSKRTKSKSPFAESDDTDGFALVVVRKLRQLLMP